MTIKRCDNCHKKISREQAFDIWPSYAWKNVELCLSCSQPIVDILKNYEVLQESHLKNLNSKTRKL
jgi:hypothetical protein